MISAPDSPSGGKRWTPLLGAPKRAGTRPALRLLRRTNVLIHPEKVCGIVSPLHRREAIVVLPEGGPHAFLALLHNEVDIGASGRVAAPRE